MLFRTIRKNLILIIFLIASSFIAIPIIHLIKAKISEPNQDFKVNQNYRDDASKLNLTKVHTIVAVEQEHTARQKQLRQLLKYANRHNFKVSISGAQHSMGGHTIYPDGISIDMLPYDHMSFDENTNILTIGSGASWSKALQYLDGFGKSIGVMQSFSNFSVGGSLSVNGHGWQAGAPPISSQVIGFTLMNADGQIIYCSRDENAELFKLVTGGYGLFGIILDIKLKVVNNTALRFHSVALNPQDYTKRYQELISDDSNVEFAYGRLRISDKHFLDQATLNYFEKVQETPLKLKQQVSKNAEVRRIVFRGSVDSEYGKRLRWDLEQTLNVLSPHMTFSRNEILNEDASLIENKDLNSTDLLHEYFIPKKNLAKFIQDVKPILRNSDVDLLNITIREILKDEDAFLNYAREDVFGLVFLFNQKKTTQQEFAMKNLTLELLDVALKYNGTYYLPYRLHVDRFKMRSAYPQVDHFFRLKKQYDPNLMFNNQFYLNYR